MSKESKPHILIVDDDRQIRTMHERGIWVPPER